MTEAENFDNRVNQAVAPETNSKGEPIVVGCNYHTTWQSDRSMRFVLRKISEGKAFLGTRTTGKFFSTRLDDLVFIRTSHNIEKANRLRPELKINYERTQTN